MKGQLATSVRDRAQYRFEYRYLPEWALPLPFQIDHVRAEKRGGETTEANLALACPHCNRHKGPNIPGFDLETGQIVRLFNPRADVWEEHFTAIGSQLFRSDGGWASNSRCVGDEHGGPVTCQERAAHGIFLPHVKRFVPDMAIEIASESDLYDGLLRKKERYLRAGTAEVWLISAQNREIAIYAAGRDRIVGAGDTLSTPQLPGLAVRVDEPFHGL